MANLKRWPGASMLVFIIIAALAACGVVTRPDRISEIKGKATKYLGKEVILEGIVKEHLTGIPELSDFEGSFRIEDGTGDMIVLDTGVPPPINRELGVKGIVKRLVIDNKEELALQKIRPLPVLGPTTMDWVLSGVVFLIGLGVIIWAFTRTLFKWSLSRKDPSGARNLSNVCSYGAVFLLVILLILFVFRGYSYVPIWILMGFGGIIILSGIIFSFAK